MRKTIFKCLEDIGFFFSEDEKRSDADIDLTEYIMDSLQFISFVVGLEEILNIELSDEYLTPESIQSLNAFIHILEEEAESQH